MPETFPVLNPDTNELEDVEHYSLQEVATRLHIGRSSAYRLVVEDRWPHLVLVGRVWIAEPDFRAIVASLRRNDRPADHLAEHPGPDLGEPLPEDPAPVDGPDQDPGGIR